MVQGQGRWSKRKGWAYQKAGDIQDDKCLGNPTGHQEHWREAATAKYLHRERQMRRSQLSGRNKILPMETYVLPGIRYPGRIIRMQVSLPASFSGERSFSQSEGWISDTGNQHDYSGEVVRILLIFWSKSTFLLGVVFLTQSTLPTSYPEGPHHCPWQCFPVDIIHKFSSHC